MADMGWFYQGIEQMKMGKVSGCHGDRGCTFYVEFGCLTSSTHELNSENWAARIFEM